MVRRPPAAARHVLAHPAAFAATALTVLAAAAAAAAGATFASAITGAAVTRSLTAAHGATIVVTDRLGGAAAPAAGRRVRAALRRDLRGVPVTVTASLRSEDLDLPHGSAGGPNAQVRVISLPGLAHRAALTAGTWPAAGAVAPAGAFPVAVPARAARLLGLTPGDMLTTRNSVTGAPVRLHVTGIFRADHPTSPYWQLSPVPGLGVQRAGGFSVYGPLVTTPAAAASISFPAVSAAWLAVPAFARLPAGGLAALGNRLQAALGGPGGAGGLAALPGSMVTTSLPALLTSLATALTVARSQLLIGVLILLAIAATAVAVSVRLLASQRGSEIALLAARGASRGQLASRGAREALALAAPAAIAGPLLGGRLTRLLLAGGPLAGAAGGATDVTAATAWLAAGLVAAGCGVIVTWPWLRRPPSPVRHRAGRGRQRAVATAVAAGGDLALVALAALAGWQLSHYQAPVSAGLGGALGVDPVLAVSPVVMLAAGTVVVLRLLPLATRLADRAAARGRGLAVAVACWRVSRTPLRQAGPALLAVLAVAAAVLTLAQHSSWQRSVADQASFQAGADERIVLPPDAPLPVGEVATVTAAPGVRASTPAVRTQASLPQGRTVTLLALDARAAAGIVPLRAGLAAGPPSALLRRLAPPGPPPGVKLPGHPARLRLSATLGRSAIQGAQLSVQLSDAAGAGYLVPAGSLPADGRPHMFTVGVAGGRHADYPLRLTGFTLQYNMPSAAPGTETLRVGGVRAAAVPGRFGPPLAAAGAGRLSATLTALTPGVNVPPQVTGAPAASAGTVRVAFTPGVRAAGSGAVGASLSVAASPPFTALPALATARFLTVTGRRVGTSIPVTVNGVTMRARLAGVISQFPTLGQAGAAIVVDQGALQDLLRMAGAPVPATEWWLRTSGTAALTGLPPGTTVIRRASIARALAAQPLSAGPQQALPAIAVAAVVLAAAGLLAGTATAGERARDTALLEALGSPPGRVAGLACLEQALLATFAAAAGLALGALLSQLIIPAVSLTAQATHPVPPVTVEVPWGLAIAAAAAIAATPTAVAAIAAYRHAATAARLRVEEET